MSKIGKIKKITKKIRRNVTNFNKVLFQFWQSSENTNKSEYEYLSKAVANYSLELKNYVLLYKQLSGTDIKKDELYNKVFEGLTIVSQDDLKRLQENTKKYKELLSQNNNNRKIINFSSRQNQKPTIETEKEITIESAFETYVID
jgi:hypothetical protein